MSEDDTLETLLSACAAGNRRAFKELYDRESPRLYGLALRMLRRRADAVDAVQDAFLQVWEKAATFDPARGMAKAWLVGILRNRAIDEIQRRSRAAIALDPWPLETPTSPDPFTELAAREDGARLRACLESLEEPKRRAILLAFTDGLPHREIADQLVAPLGTVKSWIRRGLIALKACLES